MARIALHRGSANSSPTSGDLAVIDHLSANHTVDVFLDTDPQQSGYDLIVIAESCSSGNMSGKYYTTDIPVLISEGALWDEFGLTTANANTSQSDDEWFVVADTAVSGGLSGTREVFSSSVACHNAPDANVVSGVVKAASLANDQSRWTVLYRDQVEEGDETIGRRVAFGLADAGAPLAEGDLWTLYDAAVAWLLAGSAETPVTKRLYLSSIEANWVHPGSSWVTDDTAATENARRFTEVPMGEPLQYSRPETSPDNSPWVLLGTWVTEPLTTSGTIYPHATVCAGMWESSSDADMFPFATISVTNGDSTEGFRGSPISHYNNNREFSTNEQAYKFVADRQDQGAVQFEAGDRIFIQIGYKPENSSTTQYTGTIAFGGTGSPDLDDEDTDLSRPGWVDITVSPGTEFESPEPEPHDTVRLYFSGVDSDLSLDDPSSSWDEVPSNYVKQELTDAPAGQIVDAYLDFAGSNFNATYGQWVSAPASGDGYIPAYAEWTMAMTGYLETEGADVAFAYAAWVAGPDGQRKRDVLFVEFNEQYWPYAETIDDLRASYLENTSNVPSSNIPIDEGDRIVVEVGFVSHGATSGAKRARIVYGGDEGPDLQEGDTGSAAARPPWIEIPVSEGLTFGEPDDPDPGGEIRAFGNGTISTSTESHAERVMVSSAVAPSSGTALSAVARLWVSTDAEVIDTQTDAVFAIYEDAGGTPGALLAVSEPIVVDATAETEYQFTFTGSPRITGGQTYWIGPAWRDIEGVWFARDNGGERYEQNIDWEHGLPEEFGIPYEINAGPIYGMVTYQEDGGSDPSPGVDTTRFFLAG